MSDHKTLAEALAAAQAEYPEVEKTAKANYGLYATLDSLISKTRPILNKHGLSIQQFPHVGEFGPVLRTIIRHTSGDTETADTPLFMGKQDMQQLGSAVTYARRYAWGAALGIASEHDDDGDETTKTEAKPTPAGQAQAAPSDDPADVVIHFGKNKGAKIGNLSKQQIGWYATVWEPNPQYKSAQDDALKAAAKALA